MNTIKRCVERADLLVRMQHLEKRMAIVLEEYQALYGDWRSCEERLGELRKEEDAE